MTTYQVAGPLNNEFGVIFRLGDENNFYFYSLSSDGYYHLRKLVDGEWETLIDWTESTAINTGEASANVLGLLAEGPQISLLVNGTVLDSVADDAFAQGSLALGVGTIDEGGVEIAFEDLTLWQPGGEPVETPTAEPTASETPSPVATPDVEAVMDLLAGVKQADPDYSSDFRRPDEDWPTYTDENATVDYADRAFLIKVDAPKFSAWSAGDATSDLNLADFYMEVDVARDVGPADANYGVLVRFNDDNNFYFYGINGLGSYAFWKLVDNEWEVVSDWEKSDAILKGEGETNRLGILVQGSRVTLLVNDEVLTQVVDDAFSEGNVGLYVETRKKGGVEVSFDNVDIWKITAETAPPAETEAATPAPLDTAAIEQRVDEIKANDATATDDFRSDSGAWATGDDDDSTVAYANRALRVLVKHPDWLAWSDGDLTLGDFLLETDVTAVSGQEDGQFGLLFRKVDDQNYYFYGIDASGNFGLWKKVDDEWQSIIDWQATDAVVMEKGATRRLGVLAEGSTIALLIDGTPLAQVEDDSFDQGGVAVVSGTFSAPEYETTFDNLEAWDLSQ